MGRVSAAQNNYLSVQNSPVSGYPYTIALWFNISNSTNGGYTLALSDGTANNFIRLFNDDAGAGSNIQHGIRALGGTIFTATTSNGFTDNQWHLVVARGFSTTSRDVTLDAVHGSKGTDTNSQAVPTLDRTTIFELFNRDSSNAFIGRIAEAGVWSVALSDDEETAMFNGIKFNHIQPGSLSRYWPIWGLHSPEIELTANGIEITINNTLARYNHPPVTSFTPKWAASAPLIEVAAGGAGIRNPFGGPMVLRSPLGA